jgi:RNA polymerase-binding transcription factor DksA
MLEDYIQKAEDNITMFGDPEDDIDKEVQEVMQTHLDTACRLYDRFENELETLKHGGGGACPDCEGEGQPLPDGANHEEYSRCGNCKGWVTS